MMKKKHYPKQSNSTFSLDYNFADPHAMDNTIDAIIEYTAAHDDSNADMTVKDIIRSVNAAFYDNLSRGDKCRVGRGVSKMINMGEIISLERGEKKGSTNTYHIVN